MKVRSVARPWAARPRPVWGPTEHGTPWAVLGRPLRGWARPGTARISDTGRAVLARARVGPVLGGPSRIYTPSRRQLVSCNGNRKPNAFFSRKWGLKNIPNALRPPKVRKFTRMSASVHKLMHNRSNQPNKIDLANLATKQ